jgi:alanine racemase
MSDALPVNMVGSSLAQRPAWLEIDLDALVHNYNEVQRLVGDAVQLFACLKGNAYGCGASRVARALHEAGCRAFAFGNIDDALAARAADVSGRMLLYPVCLPESAALMQTHRLIISIGSATEAQAWNEKLTAPHPIFIKIDAGALRAGVLPARAADEISRIAAFANLHVAGAFGHIHEGDESDRDGYVSWQADNFVAAVAAARDAGVALPLRMLSSSATLLGHPTLDFNAVDPGRLLFGLGSTAGQRSLSLRPVLAAFKTRLVQVRDLGSATTGGFKTPFELRPNMRTGLLPIGWGDGLPTQLLPGSQALVRGRRVALLPTTHLEQTRIDLTNVPDAELGDEVVLFGQQGDVSIGLDEACSAWGMTATHFQARLGDRVPRRYLAEACKPNHGLAS